MALTENTLCPFARLLQDSRKAEARKHVNIDLKVLVSELIFNKSWMLRNVSAKVSCSDYRTYLEPSIYSSTTYYLLLTTCTYY